MNKVRWGLIGCGDIAQKRVAPAMRDSSACELVAVTRAQSHLAESFAKQFGAKSWYANWKDLLADDEVDAVYVSTPVHLHAEQTIAAAEAGKHVLCEKPMALNPDECDRMIAAAEANNVKLGVAYYRHFYPVVARVKAVIESGEIGTPVLVQINAFEWFDPPPGHPRSWLLKKELAGGGPMFDFGCHRIEVLLNLFGPVKTVTGMVSNVLLPSEVREVEDTAAALFQFASATCGVLTVTHAAREPQDILEIFGSAGSIKVPVLNEGQMRVLSGPSTQLNERSESHPAAANLHAPLIEDFVAAVVSNREPLVNGAVGRMVASIEAEIYARGSSISDEQIGALARP
jgi:predicted dehydrogenase